MHKLRENSTTSTIRENWYPLRQDVCKNTYTVTASRKHIQVCSQGPEYP